MLEWLLLICLVPILVIPIVWLFGFAGCHLVFGLNDRLAPPSNVVATPTAFDAIRLTWVVGEAASQTVKIARRGEGETLPVVTEVTGTAFDDTGLLELNTYFYELSSISGGEESASVAIQATTLGFLPVFAAVLTNSQGNQGGRCVVQRIEPVRLVNSGTRVRITVAAPADGAVVLDRVTISRAAGPGYDAAADLTPVATNVLLPAGTSLALPLVDYALDRTQPLLVAFDVSPPGNLAFLPNVPAVEASAFVGDMHAAGVADRPDGFTARDRVFLIERIETA